ncbi:unnamed protein product [Cylindrotheca closterium]|uniref:Uncharacterized protein n=1 Tax=Cylindrotheca closterium TaxID=2856 RepID=A0AAD2PVI7_9STRA|nr:unnamed protein product [Cylindrotheca closterium]
MSYHAAFHHVDNKTEEKGKQHCMRCHKSFDPAKPSENSSTACVMLSPCPFMGHHTTNAKEVDYNKFDICDPNKCGTVLHSFTFHLRLIQAEKECHVIQQGLDRQDSKDRKRLEDQLEFLQKIKMRQAKLPKDKRWNAKRVKAINQQYDQVVELMIEREAEKLQLETWTRQVLNPTYQKKEKELFAKAPQAEPKARKTWARIEQLAATTRQDDDDDSSQRRTTTPVRPMMKNKSTTSATTTTHLKTIRE